MNVEDYRKSLEGKKILVVGLARSGRAAVEALCELGSIVSGQDSSTEDKLNAEFVSFMKEKGVKAYLGEVPEDMTQFDMLVMSPGVPIDLPFINAARDAGVEIIGELELAYRINRGKFIGITGTNGKTTTTTLVGEIFKASGRKTAVVGNIGNPVVAEAVHSTAEDWMVTEVSSFQLQTCSCFEPVVSAILNLTPDHLNRHKTMENYGAAKASIAANQTEEEYMVVNYDDKLCYSLSANTKARVVPFSRLEKLEFGAYLDNGMMVINDGEKIVEICRPEDLKIIGEHNVENALAAAAITYFAGIDPEVIAKASKEFGGVEHRIEYSGEVDGVQYYNDSKGTNVDASIIAIRALKNNIILIAGGDGKAQDFTALAEYLEGRVKALVLLGRDAPIIEEAARKAGFTNIYNEKDMPAVVRKCHEIAENGDKVLLSPACASWDMYDNFETRGRHFKDSVKELIK